MLRHRKIAAAPERTAFECWETITDLIRESVARSKHITEAELETSLEVAGGIGKMLVAAGHLDKHPLIVVASDLHLSLTTVSGDAALSLDENLSPVMGAAEAETWTLYLPSPSPLENAVRDIAAKDDHLSSEDPPTSAGARQAPASLVDRDALRKLASPDQ